MINYYHTDNLEYMRSLPDDFYDLGIADPEQGKEMHGGKTGSGIIHERSGKITRVSRTYFERKDWDLTPAKEEYFEQFFRVTKHQIIWGEQYYFKNFGPGRVVWDKINGTTNQYDVEIAYQSLTDRAELIRFMWNGMMQGKSITEPHIQQANKKLNEKRIHPCQKPSQLYAALLDRFQIPRSWKIFDPNLGSGSIGIACLKKGYSLDACEKELDYYLDAKAWLENEIEIINAGMFCLGK